jgi:ABC-type transporter Mla subunit MlaD
VRLNPQQVRDRLEVVDDDLGTVRRRLAELPGPLGKQVEALTGVVANLAAVVSALAQSASALEQAGENTAKQLEEVRGHLLAGEPLL